MSQNAILLPTSGVVSGLQMTLATNNALDTINTLASGASAPSSPEAGQFWHDTTNNILKIRSLDNTTWVPFLQINESAYSALPYFPNQISGTLNRLVNGGMNIDQVNEGASYSVPVNNTPTYAPDQWVVSCLSSGSAAGVTAQRVTDAPAGFVNSLKITVGTGAGSVGATDFLYAYQPIEANNLNDLNYGTTSAVSTSLSFWVKSSVTGTFAAVLQNVAGNRAIVNKFTIASAGVWQLVTISNIVGDQSGTWATGANAMMNLFIVLATGTTNQSSTLSSWLTGNWLASNLQTNGVLTTSGATFQIAGAMFNPGPFSLPFEKRPVQQELQLCERYFQKNIAQGTAVAQNAGYFTGAAVQLMAAGQFGSNVNFRSPMRVSPTIATFNPAAANVNWRDATNSADRTVTVALVTDKGVFFFGASGATGSTNNLNYTASARM